MVITIHATENELNDILPYVLYRICMHTSRWRVRVERSRSKFNAIDAYPWDKYGFLYKLSRVDVDEQAIAYAFILGIQDWMREKQEVIRIGEAAFSKRKKRKKAAPAMVSGHHEGDAIRAIREEGYPVIDPSRERV